MPSTTTYYGWTYPISSDDLNAGATSVGSLATGIDSTVKSVSDAVSAETTARAAAVSAEAATRAAADAARPTGTMSNIDAGVYNVTTNANGVFTNPGGLTVDQCLCANAATSALFWSALVIDPYSSNQYMVLGQYQTQSIMLPVASATVAFRRVSWS